MKKNYKVLLLVLLLAFASCSFTSKTFDNSDKDKLLIQVITYVLQQGHFDPIQLNDEFSEELFKDYIERVDPVKRYFYESDYKEFKKYETDIDDQLKAFDISFFNVVHQRMLERIEEAKLIYKDVLSTPFDYTIDETFETDYDKIGFVSNKKEMKERWRKQLKFSTISNYDDLIIQEKRAKENDASYVMKTNEEMEKEAREATLNSLDIYFNDNVDDLTREDWFAMYVNAIVEEFDPHTYYLAPQRQRGF